MAKTIYDNADVTSNSKQLAVLKKHFPQCFDQNGAFMPEKMQDIVGDSSTEFSKESYALTWLGKSYARLLANENPRTLLSEDTTHNAKAENKNSENLLIKGDNLEVLKHLVHAYSEQVKMIYIDPPYNTGSDGFVYQDNRKFTVNELSRLAGIEPDESKRILDFTQSKANSHSAWLTFMYPRLYIARDLLREDGVIFISIDDIEVAQLKMLCDEIFGEQNFIAQLIWERAYAPKNDAKFISNSHDYVLMYVKSTENFQIGRLPRTERANARYKNSDNDSRGVWKASDMSVKTYNAECDYPITTPSGRVIEPPKGRCWSLSKSAFLERLQDNRIYFGVAGNNVPCIKRFLSELKFDGMSPQSIMFYKNVGHSQEGAKEVTVLLEEGAFDGPKPLRLLRHLLILSNVSQNGIVIDFFAGSGTTAHAVMQLNAEDGGNRRCISVQIDEITDKKSEAYKAGYNSIFEITKARIEKAAVKIKQENPDYQGDLGFKVFETKPIPEDYLADIATLSSAQQQLPFASNNVDDILTTWKVYDGIALTQTLHNIDLAGYSAQQHDKICYFMHTDFNSQALVAFLQRLDDTSDHFEVEKLVVYGNHFSSKYQREIAEAVSQYQNRKDKKVHVEFRY